MKTLLIICAAIALLSSCSTYQMNTLSSTNTVHNEQTGEFKLENDSVKILYSFAGENVPIRINIYNKLNEPIYADWERSAFVMNKKSTSYADGVLQVNGTVSSTSIGRGIRYSDGSINAQVTLPHNLTFIPPHSQISKTITNVDGREFQYIADTLFAKSKLPSGFGGGDLKVKMAKFEKGNSPLVFKSYLTLYTLNNSVQKLITYQNDFYVSEAFRSSLGPENFANFGDNRGDHFYIKIPD
ncbi:hypothetical protein [Mucilaginibacter lappiensis]|uniref:Uncharacterized protein n=1 Tax=Mucilaginibacter lappiensis TaxID=354630 RepID=A0A841J7G4_9SPHI|nr:hypothetical protein [Mucilaginibacter lappiensis]MBB6126993.1 hypothetical protein [Mucilaginibacter lappiensis]